MKKKIIVLGGGGHIGLPLSLILAKKHSVSIVDPSAAIEIIKKKKSPFLDKGISGYLKNKKIFSNLSFFKSLNHLKNEKYNFGIVTLGTPVDEWGNPIVQDLELIIKNLSKKIIDNGFILLRSTVTPGFTKKISKKIKNINFAYCPERIAQGKSFTELFTLPQIIGIDQEGSNIKTQIKKIFFFSKNHIFTDSLSAELSKLFANFWRYSTFAISNQIYLLAKKFDRSPRKIIDIMKFKYPRSKDIPSPGLAAGPCLFKDTQQLIASSNNQCEVGKTAISVNEGIVYSICEETMKMSVGKKIIILGAAFKANCDDHRDSLSFKIFKHLKRITNQEIIIYDPLVKHSKVVNKFNFQNIKKYFFILATPHIIFNSFVKKISKKNIINIWNE